MFNADDKSYQLVDVSLSLPLDEATFPGAKDTGQYLRIYFSILLNPTGQNLIHSFSDCSVKNEIQFVFKSISKW